MVKKRVVRIIKWFFGIIAGLVMLITALLYIYKDEICGLVIDELNKYLKTEVRVSEVELTFWGSFPNLSVDFNNVFIRDSYPGSTDLDTLLYSDRIRLKINPMDIWRENYTVKSIEVSPGVLKLKVNEEGVNNFDILKERKEGDETEGFELKLNEVEFEQFRFSYVNAATQQEYRTRLNDVLLQGAFDQEKFTAQATSDLQILTARSGNINLVSNKPAVLNIGVKVDKTTGTVTIPASTIHVANLPFDFEGEVKDSTFYFHLNGKNIAIEDAANNLAMKEVGEVRRFQGTGKFLFNLSINGDNNPVQPVTVDCKFGVNKATLKEPSTGIALSKLTLNGHYSNKGGAAREFLKLSDISFSTKGGPFQGNLSITHFAQPVFTGAANGTLDLAVVHALFPMPKIETLQGSLDLHADFQVQGVPDPSGEMSYDIERCEGDVFLHNAAVSLIGDKRLFRDINGKVYLRNNEFGLDKVSLALGSSDFLLNGVFRDMVDYFSGKGDLKANVSIRSQRINIDEDLGSETKEEKIQQGRSFVLPDNISGEVYLEVDKMIYSKHSFEQIRSNMTVNGRIIHFPKLTLRNGGSQVFGSLTIQEESPEIFRITSQVVSNDIDFKKLFREWEDFKQDVVKSENISGDAQANVEFEALFDLRNGIIPKSIVSRIGIQIDNGRLKNVGTFNTIVESLRSSKVTRLALSKEEISSLGEKLQDLRFERMTNTLIIRDEVLEIPSMSIESSALTVQVAGKHTFDNRIDYRFGFYFRDLKQKKQSEFGIEKDDGLGVTIFMRMYGNLNNPTIEWDKDARKEQTKAYNEKEKEDIKAMLKSEFGLFKKDTTVREFIKTDTKREQIEIEFNPDEQVDPLLEDRAPKRNKKEDGVLNKWRKEAEENKKKEIDLDGF